MGAKESTLLPAPFLGSERLLEQEGMQSAMALSPNVYVQSIVLRSGESPVDKRTSRCALKERRGGLEGGMWASVESTWGLALNASGAPGAQA